MGRNVFGWSLPPGVSAADCEPPPSWAELFEGSEEFRGLNDLSRDLFYRMCESDLLYPILEQIAAYAYRSGADDAKSADGEWWDCHFMPRLELAFKPYSTLFSVFVLRELIEKARGDKDID